MKKQYPLTKAEFKAEVDKYFGGKNIRAEDDLVVVIRAHLLVEMLIEMLLKRNLLNEKILNEHDFTFDMRLTLADSLRLIPDKQLVAIKQLNSIRNKFAHSIKTRIKELDINKIMVVFENKEFYGECKDDKKLMFGLGVYYLLGYLVARVFE